MFYILSNHNGMTPEINSKKKLKFYKHMVIKYYALNKQWVIEKQERN
jgi:hypothetical protein